MFKTKSFGAFGLPSVSSFLLSCILAILAVNARAEEPDGELLAGHSAHGEAFNQGPRQAAYLMPGMGNVEFPISTENELAQRFFNQGVAQLHGFWYYEAERSFRQVAVIDPECAMAYWGMAMANTGNRKRARGFMVEAEDRKESATPREQLYIDALEAYYQDEDSDGKEIEKKTRAQKYTRALEEIVEEYPEDIEAKAFLALQLWQNGRADLPIVSHVAIDSVLEDVFDANPMHPAHHYRIHLWDGHKPKRAVGSAALAGQSLPGVAHMWHMPGHIYDKLNRYHDAVWQQEASARVDHAHMMRDRVMPDQIHNFAHNNEWLTRNLLKIGRIDDALALAKNMQELPRHPEYNTLAKGSTKYGRERLLLALSSYRLWPQLIELSETMYLEPTDKPELQVERLSYLAMAYALSGQREEAERVRDDLQARLTATESQWTAAKATEKQLSGEQADSDHDLGDDSDEKEAETVSGVDAKKAAANLERRKKKLEKELKSLKSLKEQLEKAVATATLTLDVADDKWAEALELWKDSNLKDNLLKAEWQFAAGETEEALKLLDKEIEDKPGQLLPIAVKAWVQYQASGAEAAKSVFAEVRKLASTANLDTPLLARMNPLATALGFEGHWAEDYIVAEDTGERPAVDSLGSFRWQPYMAPDFSVVSEAGESLRLKQLSGKPTLVIFYLGFGCLHCVEQLHEFSPRAAEFRESGIELIAISTETIDSLKTALDTYSKPLEIPLHADPSLTVFKAYRCFDDFEQQPLHGTFLIDPNGRVLWQDISYEPFMDVDFAFAESHRLLKLAGYEDLLRSPRRSKTVSFESE